MPGTDRCLLVLPISPAEPGNGLAHRCRFWREVVGELGELTTVVVPVSGPAWAGDLEVRLEPAVATDLLPVRCRRATEPVGRAWAKAEAEGRFDVIVAVRADVAPFALGVSAGTDAVVVVDLDDDDEELHASMGDAEEAARYARLVRDVRSRADLVTSVTGFAGTVAVPNTVEVPDDAPAREPVADRILMVGNFTYGPNLEGVRWFLDEVGPRLASDWPGVEVVLAGPGSEDLPGGLGFVADVGALYAQASVAVVPLLHGSGSRIKALEAFAFVVPVVGTTVGLSGLPVTSGIDCLVADDPAELADAVVRVLAEPALGDALAAAAFAGPLRELDRDAVRAGAVAALRAAAADGPERALAWASGLIPTETPAGLVVMDDHAMVAHELNPVASAVLVLVDGESTPAAMAAELAEAFATDPAESAAIVDAALAELVGSGLVVSRRRAQGQ